MSLPNFLIIGAMKAGTTSVFRYLGQHPDVFMPDAKEPQFFCGRASEEWEHRDPLTPARLNLAQYRELFANAGETIARGEASTTYLCDPGAPGAIRTLVPDAKLIAILRQPIDRAYSAYLMKRRQGWERLGFEKALAAEPRRIEQGWDYSWHYAGLSRYHDNVARYFALFPASQLKIVIFDDLVRDRAGVLKDLFRFLQVDDSFEPDVGAMHNTAYLARSPSLHRWMTRPSAIRERAKRLLPASARSLWDAAASVNRRLNVVAPPRLTGALRAKLTRQWDGEIAQLETLIGRDLAHWRK